MYEWIENPHPLKRKVPEALYEDFKKNGVYTVDVWDSEMNRGWGNLHHVQAFMSPSIVSHYRRSVESTQFELPLETYDAPQL